MLCEMPARVAASVLDRLAPGARPLVAGETLAPLVAALRSAGAEAQLWTRHAAPEAVPAPWPPEGRFTAALVRLPKGREALAMMLHAVAARLDPGAPLALFGANGEGIRSADRDLDAVAEAVETVETKRHCRVLCGRLRATIDGHRPHLADWRHVAEHTIGGERCAWVSYPGLFAHGRIDAATELLLASLPPLKAGARVLDFGCGSGVIARAVQRRTADAALDLLDRDTLALEAARENVPGARLIAGETLAAVAGRRYDLIVSNPPIHLGLAEDTRILMALIAGAPRHLAPGGRLVVVVQRRVRVKPALEAAFGEATSLADDRRFSVFAATGAKGQGAGATASHRRRNLE